MVEERFFPAWAMPMAGILLALLASLVSNFGQYWTHRLQHTIPILWRFHSVHHSIENMDALNSYTHPLDLIGELIAALILAALIGLKFDVIPWYIAFLNIHDRLLHTRAPINFGFLGVLLVDNRYHFMHHSMRLEDYNCNYSSHYTLWDHLFRTYRKPRPFDEIVTGTIEKLPPRNLKQFFLATRDDRPSGDGTC
jgi:sterol desaturase/sphingolipid hydroxylase (fatty acid hydroxylase superfamily)